MNEKLNNDLNNMVHIPLDLYEDLLNKSFIVNSLLFLDSIDNTKITWINWLLDNYRKVENHSTGKKLKKVVVVATEDEVNLVKQRYSNLNYDCIIKTGVGALNVLTTLKDLPKDTEILNIGFAGSNILDIGTEVDVGYSKLYHPNVEFDDHVYILKGNSEISCYTSNDFVLKTSLVEPVVFDMELAYIMALGFTNVHSIKVVSDNLNLHTYEKNIKINLRNEE